jgi:Uncharacterized membrane protein, required for spore maturation in B.subtilis.
MLNYLWGAMILIGVVYGGITGNMSAITDAALTSAKDAVNLCITMVGVMSLWMGIMQIATNAGIIENISKKIQPFVYFMFPGIPKNHKASEYITTNIIANFLGLGWAATPAGLKAMEELSDLNNYSTVASREMCTFLILNISSIQLIPVNMIAYRSQYGSVNPAEIVGPAIVATFISAVVGIIFAKVMARKGK